MWEKKQDGGHRNDADGPIVFSDELLSAKKIRRMRRSLHTIAKEESVRPGILFSGRSDKNVMIFPLSFLQLFAVTQWQCNFRQRRLVFWHLIKDIFFSFRRLKIDFLSIFCLIRRHGVWKHERSQSKSTSMKLMSMKKELLKCWWTTTLLPSYRVSKTVLALYISFSFNPRSDKQNIFPPPWASKNIPKRLPYWRKIWKNREWKKRLDHSICFQPCISPERYETLEFSFLIFGICPQTS